MSKIKKILHIAIHNIGNFNKLSLPVTILLASIILGGFYYASEFNKQKSIEKQQQVKIQQERQEKLANEIKEQTEREEAEQNLTSCINQAEQNYSDQWFIECKSQGKLTSRCIALHDMTFDEYAKQNNIPEGNRLDAVLDFYKERDDCSCRLPLENADRIDASLDEDKAECFKKYPQ